MIAGIAPPERQGAIRLSDGRVLAWSEWGADDARPVLFCTGAAMSGSLGFGADALGGLGLRLLAIDRPGLGSSDPHPGKTLMSWTDDIAEFIGRNKLQKVTAVGFSQGAAFAFALAARGLVDAVTIVSGQDELAHPRMVPLLHRDVAAMVEAVLGDSDEFERWFSQIATADGLWRLIIDMSSDRDRRLYLDESFSEAYLRSVREGFSQGPAGYARDLANALNPWPFELEHIAAPVDLWYGLLDTSTVHSPDFGATLESRLTNCRRFTDRNEGGSILWTKSRAILASLLDRADHRG
jgi:pimeloyl-ACP methyl ester carboxylesterase